MKYPNLLIKKVLSGLGYSVTRKQVSGKILVNVFNTSHNKNALLSYIRSVFEGNSKDNRHTNRLKTHTIAEILNELGYNIDVVDCSDDFNGDFGKYDMVIGLGKSLDHVLKLRDNSSKTKVVWFGTGCNPLFSNPATIKRVADFYKRHGKLMLSSSRYIKDDTVLQHEFADWIILHGSKFAKATFRTENISTIHAPVFIKHTVTRSDAEWAAAKQNYIWFGSDGAIHKGLDLVIDTFKELKNCTLHICGQLENEKEFFNYYGPVINSAGNIKYHGFVNVESDKFKEILKSCAFVIYPSASEGNSPAVITCMANGGLIPIVSESADVDIDTYGILIKDLTIQAVNDAVKQSQQLSVGELELCSRKIVAETNRVNTFEYFKTDFKAKLQEALNNIK
jgi:glycosyltransferase involved in cell wall biosynthesis